MSASTPHRFSPEEYFALSTKPTSNDMFDNGAWLAPVLDSRDPRVDRRATHVIHFYAEGAELSVCGNRFGPDHYVETHPSPEETRRRCTGCHRVVSAVRAGTNGARVFTALPGQSSYTVADFRALIAGKTRIRMRVNRHVTIDDALYLMVDHGIVQGRTLRRDLSHVFNSVSRVELVWASTTAAERAEELREEARESLLIDIQSLQPQVELASPFAATQNVLPPDPAALASYMKRRAEARRQILGQEPPAPQEHVDIFNAAYDAASPDWPIPPAQPTGRSDITTAMSVERELVA